MFICDEKSPVTCVKDHTGAMLKFKLPVMSDNNLNENLTTSSDENLNTVFRYYGWLYSDTVNNYMGEIIRVQSNVLSVRMCKNKYLKKHVLTKAII